MRLNGIQVWDIQNETQTRIDTSGIFNPVSTTLTYIGRIRVVRMSHYLRRYAWVFVAIVALFAAIVYAAIG